MVIQKTSQLIPSALKQMSRMQLSWCCREALVLCTILSSHRLPNVLYNMLFLMWPKFSTDDTQDSIKPFSVLSVLSFQYHIKDQWYLEYDIWNLNALNNSGCINHVTRFGIVYFEVVWPRGITQPVTPGQGKENLWILICALEETQMDSTQSSSPHTHLTLTCFLWHHTFLQWAHLLHF